MAKIVGFRQTVLSIYLTNDLCVGQECITADAQLSLVSDIGVPMKEGYALIRQVHSFGADEGGNVPAAASTAYAQAEDRTKVALAGF